jgi:uncharacterized protein (DUF1697 family)
MGAIIVLMSNYIAMLRGIGPGNPNMHGDRLRSVFESMDFNHVQTLLSSGNVVFSSNNSDIKSMQTQIESTIFKQLDFTTVAIIRPQAGIQKLINSNPFKELKHENAGKTYLTVTFFKDVPVNLPRFPYKPEGKYFELVAFVDNAICSVIDLTKGKTPDIMVWLERQFGKEITTRTWLTMNRILIKLNAM